MENRGPNRWFQLEKWSPNQKFPNEIKPSHQCLSAALLEYSPEELPALCLSPSPVAFACKDGHLVLVPRSREAWPSRALSRLPPLLLTLLQSRGVSSSGGAGSPPLLRAVHHILCLRSDSSPVVRSPSSACASPRRQLRAHSLCCPHCAAFSPSHFLLSVPLQSPNHMCKSPVQFWTISIVSSSLVCPHTLP